MTGLRINTAVGTLRKRLAKLDSSTRASEFRPELERFTQRTLNDCIASTKTRSEALIVKNQRKQYANRINYIPSYHELIDPSLIVKDDGAWVYFGGKWYNSEWRLPAAVWNASQDLTQERNRRMTTAESVFIAERKQARFLYRKSWVQVAQSLGFGTQGGSAILSSHSRHNPPKEPQRAYGQWRGGKSVLSVAIFNPFLDIKTMYWLGNGKQILAQATAKNRARFYKEVDDKVKRNVSAARRVT